MRREESIARFLYLEGAIRLLSRCRPVNFTPEAQALQRDWQAGQKRNPRWNYAPAPKVQQLRDALSGLRSQVVGGPWADLWSARCDEFASEIELIHAVGQPTMRRLAARRFCDPEWASEAKQQALEWLSLAPDEHAERQQTDSPEATSLLSRMQRAVSSARLPFRVLTSDTLVSAAATGEGVIWVASGGAIFAEEAPRIVVHEVVGHASPRVRARSEECELFTVGSAKGNDTQEGYAVWWEVRSKTQTVRRRQELALRHLAALCVWQGGDWVQTVEHLLECGASLCAAQAIAMRAHRGGGLGREVIYLQAYCKLRSALLVEPELLAWLGAGRLDLQAIACLRAMGYQLQPQTQTIYASNSAITGM